MAASRPKLVASPVAVQRVVIVVLIAGLLALLAWMSLPPAVPADVQSLAGSWSGVDVDTRQPVTVDLPGVFAWKGMAPDAHVQLSRTVTVGPGMQALRIDSVLYAAAITWDGVPVGEVGAPSGKARAWSSLLVPLPPGAGEHVLGLELHGDYGKGGTVGRLLLGPFDELRPLDNHATAVWLGFTFGLSLLALSSLAVGTLGSARPSHMFFGLFTGTVALWAFPHWDGTAALLGGAIGQIRLARVAEGLMPAMAVVFVSSFLGETIRKRDLAWIAGGCLLALLGVVLPGFLLLRLEAVQDVFLVVGVAMIAWVMIAEGTSGRARGVGLMMVSLIPLAYGAVDEMVLTHGLRAGGSHLFTSLVLFFGVSSAALAVQHAEDAERHRRMVRGSVDAIVGVARDGAIAIANPAAEALLGVRPRNLLEWVHPSDQPHVRAHLVRSTEAADRAEFRLMIRDRELVVESNATPLDPTLSLLVLRDVTRRRQIDRGILQAARMETVAVLVGGIAHDFNNMLGTLLAHVGYLQATVDEADATDRLNRMESTIERASLLTRRLLTVAGGTSSDLLPVQLGPVCQGAAELVEPTLSAGVHLTVDVPPDLPPILGSSADLEHVLVNLLVNARDAVGIAGNIRIAARRFAAGLARGVVICVEDDGPGVPAAIRDEIFTPFFTTKGPNRGSGLGLAVASQILRDHHGRIWYEDRPGGGARLCIALRHVDTVDQAPAPLPEGRRVLLVEDEQTLLDSYASALRTAGYEVRALGNAVEAWAALHQGPPDILVTDVVMPQITGLELATLCRTLHPDVPVLLVSGFIPDQKIDALADGTWFRLDKPVRAARLVATVGRLCRRAERSAEGELDITAVNYLFPPLDGIKAAEVGI
jgi:two-component system cell cycle sensor histidine kinase/response regulator CckA